MSKRTKLLKERYFWISAEEWLKAQKGEVIPQSCPEYWDIKLGK